MPLVEYRCTDCTQIFERLVPHTAGAERADCPTCGPRTAERLLSVFATARPSGASVAPAAAGGCCGGSCCARN